eukprot:TRINITY_DN2441_c0_g1_i2.p1 TRINITY_DN2441_c0_g1~~TRINITY_DN2441_c0_g1_i2.p1  ORF type:complete len:196 (-),score=48.70 TRINITY_DN2441_c0_g1_i2:153-740(-)
MDSAKRRLMGVASHLAANNGPPALEAEQTSAVLRELQERPKPVKKSMSLNDFKALVGKEVGLSNWFKISQERVNAFADATGDHQWIHIDPERARAESPFGGPIAHGFLTLSLLPMLNDEAMPTVDGIKMGVNYGLQKVRFVSPVPVDASVRARTALAAYEPIGDNVIQALLKVTIEIEGNAKPAVVVEWLVRWYV